MKNGCVLFLVLAGICLGQADNFATARISVTTTFGDPVQQAQVLIKSVGPPAQYKQRGSDVRFDRLPFGLYVIDVQAPGFVGHSENAAIYQADVFYRIGLAVAPPHLSERSEISGQIVPTPRNSRDVLLRLVGLYTGGLIEEQPDQAGRFNFVGIEPGRYIMLALRNGHLLESKEIEFFGGKLIVNIKLGTAQ